MNLSVKKLNSPFANINSSFIKTVTILDISVLILFVIDIFIKIVAYGLFLDNYEYLIAKNIIKQNSKNSDARRFLS